MQSLNDQLEPHQIATDDFVRRFALRTHNLMWLLGAGASAAAGVPTAIDMSWEFKQLLYTSQRNVSPQAVADLSNPSVRATLQAHVDAIDHLPPQGAPDEYAALFEEAYPAEADRRTFLHAKITGAKPSYGQLALATLMHAKRTRVTWTTNFDTLITDSCAKVFDTTAALTTVSLDSPDLAVQAFQDEQWPLEIKLHGDFRSRRLKNTNDELRHQDQILRQLLITSCQRFGLIVVGFSGRDESVMDALATAAESSGSFPAGLFWLHRGEDPPSERVIELLNQANHHTPKAFLIHIDNFDETLRDLIAPINDIDTTCLDAFSMERRHWSPAPRIRGRRSWPVVRLNALHVLHSPSVCRRIVCDIGGSSEVRGAIEQAEVDVIAVRSRGGVLAFGADSETRIAFEPHIITDFDLYTFNLHRQQYESSERWLLRQGLTRALTHERHLDVFRQRGAVLLAPSDPDNDCWESLKQLVGPIIGCVTNCQELTWREGISVRLDWANDRLWMLFDPCTVFDDISNNNKAIAADFARTRFANRYNRTLNSLFGFWSEHLAQNGKEMRALGISDGIDAIYRLSKVTCFSRRA